ncbi:Protein TabA, partial [Orchesella cincta]
MKDLPFSSISELLGYTKSYNTPFYLYDQETIEAQCKELKQSFSWAEEFQNYFAVKANPNPHILNIIKQQGFGVDCSSFAELLLAEATGFTKEEIFFTSNNTTLEEYRKAIELGAIINFDDTSHLQKVKDDIGLPDHVCFRYNPGSLRNGNDILGNPSEAKFGLTYEQLLKGYSEAKLLGCEKFSLHTMIISNSLDEDELFQTAEMMFELVKDLKTKLDIRIRQVNLGGGFGIPYKPTDKSVSTKSLGTKIQKLYENMLSNDDFLPFKLCFECGRFITGPAGILVTRIINKKRTYKNYLGVDASIANLLRPAMYGSYHHCSHIRDTECQEIVDRKLQNEDVENSVYDVIGSLCENNDKLATDRDIGTNVSVGDLLVFHDTGAHCSAMGFNYNGKLQCAEYIRQPTGELKLIKRAETYADLFSTIIWPEKLS